MREHLITLLRSVPFVPFVVTLKTHEVYRIEGVEQMAVAKELWTVVDADGTFRTHGFEAIKEITGLDDRA